MNRSVLWDLDDDPEGNVQHISEHGISKQDVEDVLDDPISVQFSRSSGYPIAFGATRTGRAMAVVFAEIDEGSGVDPDGIHFDGANVVQAL